LQDELAKNAWTEFQRLSWSSAAESVMDSYKRFSQKVAA
jgi:hypothetical protein